LIAEGIIVRGQVLLIAGFRAEGEVSLLNAQIDGNLECEGGTFINPLVQVVAESGTALTADRAKVGGSVVFTNGFRAEGIVRLPFVHIGGDLETLGGTFTAAVFSLEYASAGTIVDDERSWPKRGNLFLNGFIYEQISPPGYVRSAVLSPQDVETRLKWLNLQPERPFNPQPYLQLAKVLRGIGNYAGATTVLEEMERRRRHLEDHTPTDRIASWVFRESIGYGHDPLRAIWMILGLSVIGWYFIEEAILPETWSPATRRLTSPSSLRGAPQDTIGRLPRWSTH
jgi:hypothetical protein